MTPFYLDDLSVFFNDAEFGKQVTIGGVTIKGIFDNGTADLRQRVGRGDYIADFEVTTAQPVLLCKSSDVANVQQQTHVVIDSKTYMVVDIDPDGTGITALQLQQV